METLEEVLPSAEEQGEQEEEIEMEEEEMEEEEEIEEKEEEIEEMGDTGDAAIKDDAADGLQKEEKEEGGGKERGGGDEPEVKAIPKAADKIGAKKKKNPFPNKPKEKKPDEGLNLNNEVVRMRKEVKRVRALIIRKLTRQSGALKKKKGKETEVESNQRRAGRLLEEIHAMKTLSPDLVSKTALQKNLHFEQVCKNPKSTASDRAIARIATHPQFNKKIEDLKAAVKAFKEERMKAEKQEEEEKAQIKGGKVTPQSPDEKGERETEEGGVAVEQKELLDDKEEEEEKEEEEDDDLLEDTEDAAAAEPEKETGKASPADGQRRETSEARSVRLVSVKGSGVKDVVRNKPQAEKKPDLRSAPEVLQKKRDEEEEESDLESDDEEKDKPQAGQAEKKPDVLQKKMDEEEEESDLESDGEEKDKPEAKQAEKKPDVLQKNKCEEEESDLESHGEEKGKPEAKQAEKKPDVLQKNKCEEEESDLESDGEEKGKPEAKQAEKKPDVLQKKMDGEEEESDLEPAGEEKEYFDDSTEERFLKQSSQSEESDDGFFVGKVNRCKKKKTKKKTKKSGEGDVASTGREGAGTDKFQGELDELESRLKSKGKSFQSVFCSSLSSSKPGGGRGRGGDGFGGRGRPRGGGGRDGDFSRQPRFQKQERDSFPSGGRGRGRGRGDGMRQNDRRGGGGGFTQQAPEQALHPSWEASKKRKEQQGQILAFQGKKIKFDMDD
ncbi:serum response factor-binding protein 1 [Cyclopterus lumpus]|uniref:Serum response factor-binding protein 1 n=1 Tax=Cyclopterus lumpus TaxID=8103 RepID=A0A8C2X9A3_CYCLU|nr:serum response factor-binding protein 1 [Cyclopterus lumpus]